MGVRVALALAALVVACAIVCDASASERRHRVALVEVDEPLARALVIALTPWNLDVVRAASGPPGATLPGAEQRARALAAELGADVVVWVSPGGEQSVLWVYDAETKHVSSRVVDAALPYDDPTAAAVALSLKTLLRSSAVAPETERVGPAPRRARDTLRAEATLGGRLFAADVLEPRASLGLAWFFRAADPRLAAALALSVGPGVNLAADGFTGRYTDVTLSPSLRARFELGRVALEPQLGVSLHVTTLDGVAAPDLAAVHASRVDGSIDAGVALALRVASGVDAAVVFGLGYMTRYQTYAIADTSVLTLSPVFGELGLRLTLGVF